MEIKYKLSDETIPIPNFAHSDDAGFDVYVRETTIIKPMEYKIIPTGLFLEIPIGFVGLIWDKSGLSTKNGLKILGGVIDSGYRGEIMIGMINLGNTEYFFSKGNKIAQMLIQKVEHINFIETEKLSDTSRGESGFGSTGK